MNVRKLIELLVDKFDEHCQRVIGRLIELGENLDLYYESTRGINRLIEIFTGDVDRQTIKDVIGIMIQPRHEPAYYDSNLLRKINVRVGNGLDVGLSTEEQIEVFNMLETADLKRMKQCFVNVLKEKKRQIKKRFACKI